VLSRSRTTVAGVPQGSILGPLLFNIFVNDLSLCVPYFLVRYADDTTIVISGNNPQTLKEDVENAIKDLGSWFSENRLIINSQKTQIMLFGKKKNAQWTDFSVTVEGVEIACSKSIKILGVTLCPDFGYEEHISNALKKGGFALRLARTVVNLISQTERQLMLTSYILPNLLYCGALLVGLNRKQTTRLTRFIKLTFRILRLNSEPVPLTTLYMRQALMILHQAMHTGYPDNFSKSIQTSSSQYHMRSSLRIILPHMKTQYATNSTFIMAAKAWNSLPKGMDARKEDPSTTSFGAALRNLH
jgi:hypothetical protein